MVMSDGQWRWIDHAGRKMYYSLKLTSYIHGFNFGYTSVPHQFFTATTVKMWQAGVPEMCAWSGVDSETEALLSQTTVFTVLVEDQYIVATMEQGFLLQLFNLASGLGGYLSILTVVFGIIFVKQYPESRIAHVFESRTLFGKQAKGDPPDDEEALDDRQPYVAPASSQSPVCTASTLVSHAIGLTQVDKRELPALPPGIPATTALASKTGTRWSDPTGSEAPRMAKKSQAQALSDESTGVPYGELIRDYEPPEGSSWRYGRPDYAPVNKLYFQHRTMAHQEGSLEALDARRTV
eukprot:s4890_g4.t1